MTLGLALYQPDIAANTGTMLRLAACLSVDAHLVHPCGFPFSARALRRAGMDYLDHVALTEHDDWPAFERWRDEAGRRAILLTTRAEVSFLNYTFEPNDILLLGRESAGAPAEVHQAVDARLRIPMAPAMRSLNVAVSAGMVLSEAMRQTGAFAAMSKGEGA